MEEQAVPSEALDLSIDGRWRDLEVVGDLAVGHAAGGEGHELRQDVSPFEVVVGAEGTLTEGDTTDLACIPLETSVVGDTREEATALVGPRLLQVYVGRAVVFRAVGWCPAVVFRVGYPTVNLCTFAWHSNPLPLLENLKKQQILKGRKWFFKQRDGTIHVCCQELFP